VLDDPVDAHGLDPFGVKEIAGRRQETLAR
jgi:hypothetical protein